jgi:hypothetical protein
MPNGVAGPGKVFPSPSFMLVLAPMSGLIQSALFLVPREAGLNLATAMLANDNRLNSRLVIFMNDWSRSFYGIGTMSTGIFLRLEQLRRNQGFRIKAHSE